jgi:hypothetical protein
VTTMYRSPEQGHLTDEVAVRREYGHVAIERDDAIKAIRTALKKRTGRTWSVTGGKGTAWGWIEISSPPRRRTGTNIRNPNYDASIGRTTSNPEYLLIDGREPGYLMTPEDIKILAEALGLDEAKVGQQSVSIPASSEYREEYVARAEGRTLRVHGTPYWD